MDGFFGVLRHIGSVLAELRQLIDAPMNEMKA